MKVKLFIADTMQDALARVKSDLGRDAVILHTRRIHKGGFLGFFRREKVEVMAAIDSRETAESRKKAADSSPVPAEAEPKVTAMQSELTSMRKLIEQVLYKMPKPENQPSPFWETLIKNDVTAEIASNLVQGLPAMTGQDEPIVRQLLLERISNCLQNVAGISLDGFACKTVALVGPTGVGKTTTIAKLAANFSLRDGCKVALITADTYRIAAVEQLKTYGDIMGIAVDVVYTPEELKTAILRHQDKKLVLIDTAGRSPHNQDQLAELKELLAAVPSAEIYLVLSATTKYKDALEIVNKFSICSPHKFLFTKTDEASTLGLILNLLYQYPAALSYISTGQSVPDDIEIANSVKLANLILRD
ncbi:flagellar biosynthesis protein flhf [Lucifera butyrica]|uniref:Flagellar biosynthesis protein FlhF n=1 Tax=Lucifera butyrica TaxID=1351585 RepID=A0A498RB28_9FIRM|nr:flagellar biosynthesis protein FlhF [Lucifera butyrica]VBB08077.1 flagellar biosynthesis protein flhf [Lucifera butyrica]